MDTLYPYRSLIELTIGLAVGVVSFLLTTRPSQNHGVVAAVTSAFAAAAVIYVLPRLLDPRSRRRWLGVTGLALCAGAFAWPGFGSPWAFPVVVMGMLVGGRVICREDLERTTDDSVGTGRTDYNGDPHLRRLVEEWDSTGGGFRANGRPVRSRAEIAAEAESLE